MELFVLNIFIVLYYALIVHLSSFNEGTKRFIFLTIAFVHLMFLHTFFDATAFPDLDNYYFYFNAVTNSNVDDFDIEIGWNILNKILYFIYPSNFTLLFFVSLIMILGYILSISKYSEIPWLSVFILLCTVFYDSLFVLRQHLAMSICLLSITYIIKRKPIKFLLVTLLAISFHYSAVMWIPVYIVYSFEINRRFVLMLVALTVLFYSITEIILENLLVVTTKIMAYTDVENQTSINTFKGVAVVLSTLVLSLYSFNKLYKIKDHNKLFFQLTMMSCLVSFISFFDASFTLFSRLHLYYSISGIFLLPNALFNINNKKLYYLLTPLICVCYVFLLNAFLQYGYGF